MAIPNMIASPLFGSGYARLGRIKFGRAEYDRVTWKRVRKASRNQHLATRQQRHGVAEARVVHSAGFRPRITRKVIEEGDGRGRGAAFIELTALALVPRAQHVAIAEQCRFGRWKRNRREGARRRPARRGGIVDLCTAVQDNPEPFSLY